MIGKLRLKRGAEYCGKLFGRPVNAVGEVVFTTGMVGYPEALTDPSYRGQILVFTYPIIGNYGVPRGGKYFESGKIQTAGVVIGKLTRNPSHYTSVKNLHDWLFEENIPGLFDLDTRDLTSVLRNNGVVPGKIVCSPDFEASSSAEKNLVEAVSCAKQIKYGSGKPRLAVIDCGVKLSIIRILVRYGLSVTRVPWNWNDFQNFDGVVISNGPGDPKQVKTTIDNVKKLLGQNKPVLGICLGNQILALAAGADTYKLKYGHRSHNQPVIDKRTNRAYLTTQNHGYAVKGSSLGENWTEWFINLNDGTNEGIRHRFRPFMSVQFHPEGSPGPKDTSWIFEDFIKLCMQ